MNITSLIHLIAGRIVLVMSWPLIMRKIRMNSFFGTRVDEAFKSEECWYDINAYGGRMLFRWGMAIIAASLIGLILPERFWLAYAYLSSFIIVLGGLSVVVCKIMGYADKTNVRN